MLLPNENSAVKFDGFRHIQRFLRGVPREPVAELSKGDVSRGGSRVPGKTFKR